MDGKRFDEFTTALAEGETSRRSILQRVAGGSFAAALAAIGITGFSAEEADAKKSCKKKCKKKNTAKQRRKCKKRCKKKDNGTTSAGFPITINTTLLGTVCTVGGTECGTGTGLTCVLGLCAPIDNGAACSTGSDCSTGRCTGGVCSQCDTLNVCGTAGSQQCCVAEASCASGQCVLPQ